MTQDLDKLFFLAKQACLALERNYDIQIEAYNPKQRDGKRDGTSIPILGFELKVINKANGKWHTMGGFGTCYNEEGEIDIPDGFETKECGWYELQEKMKGLNQDTRIVLIFACWFYQYLKWFQSLGGKGNTYKFF